MPFMGAPGGLRGIETDTYVQCGGLAECERGILVQFARSLTHAQIADIRGIRPVTVRNAVYGIQDKLGLEKIQGWAVRNGLLDGDLDG